KPLSPGWEAEISDPLLREDIADAACGDPRRRLPTVAALVDRLTKLDDRRIKRSELARAEGRAQIAEQRLSQARARRPWGIAAGIALAAGLAASLILYRNATRESARANRQTAIAASVNQFLANDLLGRGNPFQSGKSTETLVEAIKQAAPDIDRHFQDGLEVPA